mmetsp:Transcript_25672/g.47837  ORF Transcript_25672/g.47837 Transcript_25672/m.47837 type:complete len:196 (-) Transcript_25672:1478-2065(-)
MVATLSLPYDTIPTLKRKAQVSEEETTKYLHKKARTNEIEPTTSSSSPSSSLVQSRVRFRETRDVIEIPDRACLTEEEFNGMYMTDDDQKRIYLEIARTLQSLKKGNLDEEEAEENMRGLESVVKQRNSDRSERMKTAISAVLKRQRFHDINETWLSVHYRPLSEEAARLARERAKRDEEENLALYHPKGIEMSR